MIEVRDENRRLKRLVTKLSWPPLSLIFMISTPGGAASEAPGEISAEIARLWPYHASLVILGFLLLVTGMTYARRKEKGWLKKHKLLGISGAAFSIAGMTMAAYMISAASQEHFRVPHAYLGSLVILLLIFTPVLGLLQLKAAKENKAKIRRVHRLLGRTALLLMALNMLFGMLIVSSA
jgi:amino acid transporter